MDVGARLVLARIAPRAMIILLAQNPGSLDLSLQFPYNDSPSALMTFDSLSAGLEIATKRHKQHKKNNHVLKFHSSDLYASFPENLFAPVVPFCGYFLEL